MPSSSQRLTGTEARNPATRNLDRMSTAALLRRLWLEDAAVARAVRRALPALRRAVDAAAERFRDGGRIIYVGAGTSGRLGALDAAECPPTFGVARGRVVALIAGGTAALLAAREGAEDDLAAGRRELAALSAQAADVVVGISASGATPYTLAALREARRRGCLTVAIACAPRSALAAAAEIAVVAPTGAEAIAGSTRMKAGSAQKTLLNFFSTALMIRNGAVYDNLMVNVQATNAKLRARAAGILAVAARIAPARASKLLAATGGDLRQAIVMARRRVTTATAGQILAAAGGDLGRALQAADNATARTMAARPRRKR